MKVEDGKYISGFCPEIKKCARESIIGEFIRIDREHVEKREAQNLSKKQPDYEPKETELQWFLHGGFFETQMDKLGVKVKPIVEQELKRIADIENITLKQQNKILKFTVTYHPRPIAATEQKSWSIFPDFPSSCKGHDHDPRNQLSVRVWTENISSANERKMASLSGGDHSCPDRKKPVSALVSLLGLFVVGSIFALTLYATCRSMQFAATRLNVKI